MKRRTPGRHSLTSQLALRADALKRRFLDLRVRLDRLDNPGRGDDLQPLLLAYKAAIRSANPPDVLLFGDSVYQRVSEHDCDRRKLGEMIHEALPERVVHATSHSAYTSYMFEAFLALAGRLGARPDHVVLPFNLRCLSPQWDGCPIWQYVQDHAIVEEQIADPSRDPAPKITLWEDRKFYRSIRFASPLSPRDTIGAFRDIIANRVPGVTAEERRREILIQHFGMVQRPGHRQLLFLRSAVEAARALGSRVTVYVTPINMELVREAGSDALARIVRANVGLVEAAVRACGADRHVSFHDWTEVLSADLFFHPHETTEHLAESGRLALAALIVEALREAETTAGVERLAS